MMLLLILGTDPDVCRDGVMDPAGPKPCAAVHGTTILVEDLFYNVPTRKKVHPLQAQGRVLTHSF